MRTMSELLWAAGSLGRHGMLGWTAPDGIAMCQNEVVEISSKGDRPWRRLFALGWIRQRAFSIARGERGGRGGSAEEAAARTGACLLRRPFAAEGGHGSLRRGASLGARAAGAGP